jgi:hypothetical protein
MKKAVRTFEILPPQLWALKGLNLRLPPCEDDRGVDSPSEK